MSGASPGHVLSLVEVYDMVGAGIRNLLLFPVKPMAQTASWQND